MKQKVVISVSMNDQKSRSKALQIVVGFSGVESAALKGEDKKQIELIGDGVDTVKLTTSLKKKMKYAQLVSVGPADADKKNEPKKEPEVQVQPVVWTYQGGVPHYDYHVVTANHGYYDPCSIL